MSKCSPFAIYVFVKEGGESKKEIAHIPEIVAAKGIENISQEKRRRTRLLFFFHLDPH